VFSLGRKHVGYGADPAKMEILGMMIVKSIMRALQATDDDMGDEEHHKMNIAFELFFKILIYWVQSGFNHEKRNPT
jgi:hypothetical protein